MKTKGLWRVEDLDIEPATGLKCHNIVCDSVNGSLVEIAQCGTNEGDAHFIAAIANEFETVFNDGLGNNSHKQLIKELVGIVEDSIQNLGFTPTSYVEVLKRAKDVL